MQWPSEGQRVGIDRAEFLRQQREDIAHLREFPGDGWLRREQALDRLLLYIQTQDHEVYAVTLALLRTVGLHGCA